MLPNSYHVEMDEEKKNLFFFVFSFVLFFFVLIEF